MSDPEDFSNRYNTPLTPAEETKFQQWLRTLPPQQRSSYDYDMRGAWKAGAGRAGNGHFPDTFKKPNHPTFSDQSQYSSPSMRGGHWYGDDKSGYVFQAEPQNFLNRSLNDLQSYFNRVEPDSTLVADINYRLPPR